VSVFSWRVPISSGEEFRTLALPNWQRIPFVMQIQQQTMWCWAAVATSVTLYFNPTPGWTQCQVASATLGMPDCCGVPPAQGCNIPNYLDRALTTVNHFSRMTPGQITSAALDAELVGLRPVGARIQWAGGGGHFVALAGVLLGASVYVGVVDPWFGPSDVALSALSGSYQGSGTWDTTYFVR
jgi:hypothetical protein